MKTNGREGEFGRYVPSGHALMEIHREINWAPFQKLLEGSNHTRRGRRGYHPLVKFKALLLQRWYGLSDPALEEAIRDRLSFRSFLGLSLRDEVPDETTICRFRGILARKGLDRKLLRQVQEQLDAKGLIIRQGFLIDATLMQVAPL